MSANEAILPKQGDSHMSTDKQITPQPHPHAEVIKAWADGKTIQYKLTAPDPFCTHPVGVWTDWREILVPPPVNITIYEWRIKPEQKTGWINVYEETEYLTSIGLVYPDRQKALDNRDTAKKHIACIEITYTEGEGL